MLELTEVTVRFGGNVAVDRVSFGAEAGRVTALIGPNGAGKTTIFNVISGLLPPTSGSVALDGRDLSGMAPHRRARLGLARTFQRLELFSALTVRDNVLVASEIYRGWSRARVRPRSEVARLLERVGLSDRADERVDQLPTGQARLVELARALATHPKVLLLDEPASGLDDAETDDVARLLTELAAEGITVMLVEHDVHLVMRVSQMIHVLDFGRLIAGGPPEEIRENKDVIEAYLGSELSDAG